MDIATGGGLADPHDQRDVPVGQILEDAQHGGRTLFRRKAVEGDPEGFVPRLGPGGDGHGRAADRASPAALPAMMIDDHAMGNGEQPGPQIAPGGRCSAVTTEGRTDSVLKAVLGVIGSNSSPQITEQRRRMDVEDDLERRCHTLTTEPACRFVTSAVRRP